MRWNFVVDALTHSPVNTPSLTSPNQHLRVRVTASARLHLGFFDLHGGLGRRFGSLGVALQAPQLQLSLSPQPDWQAHGEDSQRALKLAQLLYAAAKLEGAAHIHLQQAIPAHAGLGSGTQLALSLGAAINRAHGLSMSMAQIAQITQRATRSGIGLGTFQQGGLIVDGGLPIAQQSSMQNPITPPILMRMAFPDWPILLILQPDFQGVHGQAEVQAFQNLPEFPPTLAQQLCREVLMRALPALAEGNLPAFGQAIQQLQSACGDYFAPAQGGQRYASPQVSAALAMLAAEGVACYGQSSWGATGFAILPDEESARRLLALGQSRFAASGLQWVLTHANNQPAQIDVEDEEHG